MLKRAHKGTFHKLSPKHLDRYVQEFAGWRNMRKMDTIDIMGSLVSGMNHKRLQYEDLIASQRTSQRGAVMEAIALPTARETGDIVR